MSDTELLHRFARNMLQVSSDPEVTERLLDAAAETRLSASDEFALSAPPAVATARRIRQVPARWAEVVAAGFDPSDPDADRVLELLLADTRLGVRRAIAAVPGLPLEVSDRLMADATRTPSVDSESVSTILENQEYRPSDVLRWLTAPNAVMANLSDGALEAACDSLLSDFDAAVSFVKASPRSLWVATLLAMSGRPGPAHFVDMFPVVSRYLDGSIPSDVASFMHGRRATFDLRMVRWLTENADEVFPDLHFRAAVGELRGLTDPELIRAWWRSGVKNAQASMLPTAGIASAVIAETVAGMDEVASDPTEAAHAAAAFNAVHASSTGPSEEHLGDWVATLNAALGLLEGIVGDRNVPIPGQHAELVDSAGEALASAFAALGVNHSTDPRVVVAFARFAMLTPRHVGQTLLRQEAPVPGVSDLVAEDPAFFGMTGSALVLAWDNNKASVSSPAGSKPWDEAPELWSELVANTPGVLDMISRGWAKRRGLCEVVFGHLHAGVGSNAEAWDTILSLVPTWEGSIAELVGVAATFAGVTPGEPDTVPAVDPAPALEELLEPDTDEVAETDEVATAAASEALPADAPVTAPVTFGLGQQLALL